MHEIFSQLYCMKRVLGDPQKEMLPFVGPREPFSCSKVGKIFYAYKG